MITISPADEINFPLLNRKIGEYLRGKRQCLSLSGKELGRRIKLSQQQVSRYENGVNTLTIIMLNKILMELNVSWWDFIIDNQLGSHKQLFY